MPLAMTDVVIVGAGPAGLALTLALINDGCTSVAVVDAAQVHRKSSRAIMMHAQTLEELSIMGCSDDLVSRGFRANHFKVFAQQTLLVDAAFNSLASYTRFPYALLISQADTEGVLEGHLSSRGITVRRGWKVVSLDQAEGGIKVNFESGQSIVARYVVGADGARSVVRTAANINFSDPLTNEVHTVEANTKSIDDRRVNLVDVHLSGKLPAFVTLDSIHTFLSPLGSCLLVPLPPAKDDNTRTPIYRVACPPSSSLEEVTIPRLEEVLTISLGLPKGHTLKVQNILWQSRFRIRSAIADTFVKQMYGGTVILVGDAAHIHHPAGGQGMNLAIRDGLQLGRRLAEILRSSDPLSRNEQLDPWSAERKDAAMAVIMMTKQMSRAIGLQSWWAQRARNVFWWLLGCSTSYANGLVLRLSGLQPVSKDQASR